LQHGFHATTMARLWQTVKIRLRTSMLEM